MIHSAEFLNRMIQEEVNRFPDKDPKRIFLMGFSQGCALNLATFMRYSQPKPLGGIVCMSMFNPLNEEFFNKDLTV